MTKVYGCKFVEAFIKTWLMSLSPETVIAQMTVVVLFGAYSPSIFEIISDDIDNCCP